MNSKAVFYKDENLTLNGLDLNKLARRHGSPLYVYSSKRILEKLKLLRDAFTEPLHIHYAMKANFNRDLLKFLALQKIGVDVVSGGEISRALDCGFAPDKIIFSGVAKSEAEITLALEKRIGIFNVESPQELERIGMLTRLFLKTFEKNRAKPLANLNTRPKTKISFRLNPNVAAKTHPYITTGFRENKFGMDKSFLPELLGILKKYDRELSLVGIDFHIGSQLMSPAPIIEAAEKTAGIYKTLRDELGHPLKYFDIGGGVGISYKKMRNAGGGSAAAFDLKSYAKDLEKILKPLQCEIVTEPGRFLVGDAGVLVAQVEYIKKTPYKTFVIINSGMNHLLRPALYQAYHEIVPLKKNKRSKVKVDVVGPICESSDWLAQERMLPVLKQGELIALCDTGAYGFAMASDYNLHEKPKEIFI